MTLISDDVRYFLNLPIIHEKTANAGAWGMIKNLGQRAMQAVSPHVDDAVQAGSRAVSKVAPKTTQPAASAGQAATSAAKPVVAPRPVVPKTQAPAPNLKPTTPPDLMPTPIKPVKVTGNAPGVAPAIKPTTPQWLMNPNLGQGALMGAGMSAGTSLARDFFDPNATFSGSLGRALLSGAGGALGGAAGAHWLRGTQHAANPYMAALPGLFGGQITRGVFG